MIHIAVRILEEDTKASVKTLLPAEPRQDLNTALTALLLQKEFLLRKDLSQGKAPRVLDAWEWPLIMVWKEEARNLKLPAAALDVHAALVIYSKGPNGIDEKGAGDDVYCVPPHREP